MTPAVDTETLAGRPVGADMLEATKDRIRLIDIDSLRFYERPDKAKIAEIALSLQSSRTLINPVIVDPVRRLLIDGHHRVAAFKWLGLERIPAFTVDYFSEDVEVRGWNRQTNARPEDIERAFDFPGGRRGGPWVVLATDGDSDTLASREFETARESASYLDHVTFCLRAEGREVTLSTENDALHSGRIHSYIKPVVGKAEVIDVIARGRVFPDEVNRHLIEGRPLELHVPLDAIEAPSGIRRHIDQISEEFMPLSVDPGFRDGERVYEERVILFRPNGAHS